jgi:uncharacterized membrane protein
MRTQLIAGVSLVFVGVIWIGQGLGLLRSSSFMVDDIRWSVIGAVMAVAGVALVIWTRRRRQ